MNQRPRIRITLIDQKGECPCHRGHRVGESFDFTVSIPMFGKINSLNASAAAAVLLYEAVRQRTGN